MSQPPKYRKTNRGKVAVPQHSPSSDSETTISDDPDVVEVVNLCSPTSSKETIILDLRGVNINSGQAANLPDSKQEMKDDSDAAETKFDDEFNKKKKRVRSFRDGFSDAAENSDDREFLESFEEEKFKAANYSRSIVREATKGLGTTKVGRSKYAPTKLLKCPSFACYEQFSTHDQCRFHFESQHPNEAKCTICGEPFVNKQSWIDHVNERHEGGAGITAPIYDRHADIQMTYYNCPECFFANDRWPPVHLHLSNYGHAGAGCPSCGIYFTMRGSYDTHIRKTQCEMQPEVRLKMFSSSERANLKSRVTNRSREIADQEATDLMESAQEAGTLNVMTLVSSGVSPYRATCLLRSFKEKLATVDPCVAAQVKKDDDSNLPLLNHSCVWTDEERALFLEGLVEKRGGKVAVPKDFSIPTRNMNQIVEYLEEYVATPEAVERKKAYLDRWKNNKKKKLQRLQTASPVPFAPTLPAAFGGPDINFPAAPTSSIASSSTALSVTPATNGAAENAKSKKETLRTSKQSKGRYFNLSSTLCARCMHVGHATQFCSTRPKKQPCFVCGSMKHFAIGAAPCPNEFCTRCLRKSHPRPKIPCSLRNRRFCYRCGSDTHRHYDCMVKFQQSQTTNSEPDSSNSTSGPSSSSSSGHKFASPVEVGTSNNNPSAGSSGPSDSVYAPDIYGALKNVRCMSCQELGHINCVAVRQVKEPKPAACFTCGLKNHATRACVKTKMKHMTDIIARGLRSGKKQVYKRRKRKAETGFHQPNRRQRRDGRATGRGKARVNSRGNGPFIGPSIGRNARGNGRGRGRGRGRVKVRVKARGKGRGRFRRNEQ